MTKQKTVPELKAEIAANERQLAQLRHKQQQLENRAVYYEKGDRRKRAHRLITRGAAVESVVPLAKVLSETEFYAFAEKALALPEVKGLLMEAVNEHNKNEFGGDWPSHYSIFTYPRSSAAPDSLPWLLPPFAPAKSCTASITARTATTPARAA